MRIERVQIRAFGCLRDFDTGADPLPELVVVLGPNEAGKSTLFRFLTTALFGFRPASRELNQDVPWGGDEAGGSVDIRLDDGTCVEVDRRLMSQPSGKILLDGQTDDLRNRSLPWADHVPFVVFEQVFALTLRELDGLEGDTWATIQDRILGAMGATDLLPARDVVAQLEDEALSLWRRDRRGKPRIRTIQDQIRDLQAQRREAQERDRRLRGVVEERDGARARLEELRQERHRQRAAVERVQSLVPIRAQLRRIAALRENAGAAEILQALPSDPAGHLAELGARLSTLTERLEELDADLVEPKGAVAALGDPERLILSRAEEISSFLTRAAGSASDRARLHELEQGISDVERRLDTTAAKWLSVPWRELGDSALERVSPGELRERVKNFSDASAERRILEAAAHRQAAESAKAGPPSSLVGSIAVLASGTALLALGLSDGAPLPIALGAAATAVGVAFLVLWARHRLRSRTPAGPADSVRQADAAESHARQQVADLLEGLPVLPTVLSDPGELLVAGVERTRELLDDRRDREGTARKIRARTAAADQDATVLGSALELDAGLTTEAVVHIVDRELHRSERLREAADSGEREIRRIHRERTRVQTDIDEVGAQSAALRERLTSIGEGDAERGAGLAAERLQAARRAAELQDELERGHPDLEEITLRIAKAEGSGESWTMDDDDLAVRRARIEALDEEITGLTGDAEALDRDATHLLKEETVDAVDGEIASLQEEVVRLVRERDRAWVLAQLVRTADSRFREEHQPDLVRRAGEYLRQLTGGRYDRMIVDDTGDGGVFQVAGPYLPEPIPLAHPISTGTLEQAYLSLRLAIVDHLDRGGERLPLFVDEVFVNWDDSRLAQGVELVASVAKTRQIFFFTCHPQMAATLEAQGAKIIPLDDAS